MFKCCVCQGKSSRRTSQEDDDEDDSDVEEDSSSSSSSETEKPEDQEEREIEEELAKKFKCQSSKNSEPVVSEDPRRTSLENAVKPGEDPTEANGGHLVGKPLDREAVKEDVVEILNNAVKIVQEIRKGERERLEKIKEEAAEEAAEETPIVEPPAPVVSDPEVEVQKDEEKSAVPEEVNAQVNENKNEEVNAQVNENKNKEVKEVAKEEEIEAQKEIQKDEEEKSEGQRGRLEKLESEETEEDAVTVIEEEPLAEIKKDEVASATEKSRTDQIEEMIIEELINELNEEADNDQELKEIVESEIQLDSLPNCNELPTPLDSLPNCNELPTPLDSLPTPSPPPPPPPLLDDIIPEENGPVKELSNEVPPPYREVEIIDEIKKTAVQKIEECLLVNGDLLNIPPPEAPSEEEAVNLPDIDFPTPPPIDFEMTTEPPAVPPWDEDDGNEEAEEALPAPKRSTPRGVLTEGGLLSALRDHRPPSSPGSKSLPSPPSPPSSGSDVGNETEVESRSSGDEGSETIVLRSRPASRNPLPQEELYVEPHAEADDNVFDKEPETPKDIPPRPVPPVPRWLSQEDDEPEMSGSEGFGGMQEPPATPVARDELALRRHRFFSDLLQAARNTAEHRVSFDPLGPMVHPGCEHDDREEHLEELVSRLESVTKRLEQVTTQGQPVLQTQQQQSQPQQQQPTPQLVQTQEIAVQTKSPSPERSLSLAEELPQEEISQSSSSSRESIVSVASVVEVVRSMSVAGYEDILAGPLQDYVRLSQKIGGDVAEHCGLVQKAFQIQLQLMKTAASRPQPTDQSEMLMLTKPMCEQIDAIQKFRESHRVSPFFNHLSAISESILALQWITIVPTPVPFIKEMSDAGQYYIDRVLRDWKEKDKTHVEWGKAWAKTLTDLKQFVRQHHTTGLVWAKTGSVPAGGAPPPPPPCMMPMAEPVSSSTNDDRSALFAQINQGENITKNLKKVTSDMQTHKNAGLRTGPAPFKAPVVSNNSGSPVKTTLSANAPIDKPPVFTRDGKKWLVEYHKGNKNLVIDNVERNNVVYMFRCQDSNLVIKGKLNSIVMDSCRKSTIVFDSVIAGIEFVNCQSVQMQVLGEVSTISIDKTDGCQMYLNKDTLGVELITSKSSEMNVMVPIENNDYTEYAVPEQFKTVITPKGLSTVTVDSLG